MFDSIFSLRALTVFRTRISCDRLRSSMLSVMRRMTISLRTKKSEAGGPHTFVALVLPLFRFTSLSNTMGRFVMCGAGASGGSDQKYDT